MRKATGKVVSLVLALALVITSFSATFASAASTKTESAASVTDIKDVTLVNLSNVADDADDLAGAIEAGKSTFNISDYVDGKVTLETYDHIKVLDSVEISSVSVSGDNILRVTKDSSTGKYIATVRDVKGTGTAKINVLYTGTTTDRGDEEITVRGSDSFTVTLVDAKTPYLVDVDNLQKNPQYEGSNYKTYDSAESDKKPVVTGTAKFVLPVISSNSAQKDTETPVNVVEYDKSNSYTNPATGDFYVVAVSGTNAYLDITSNKEIVYGIANPAVGNTVRVSVYSVKDISDAQDGSEYATNKTVAQETAKVENKIVGAIASVGLGDGSKPSKGVGMKNDIILSKSKTYVELGDCWWDATGAEIVSSTNVSVSNGRVGNITATGTITVSDGTVGALDATEKITVLGGSTGDLESDADIEISDATVASVSGATSVKIDEGTITGSVSADSVEVAPLNDEASASVGAVSAPVLKIDGTYGKASAASFFAAEGSDYSLTLVGKNATIGAINADYRDLDVVFQNFVGSIAAPTKANYTGYQETGARLTTDDSDSEDATKATVSGALAIQAIELDSGAVTFGGNVNVDEVYGSEADFIINAGALYIDKVVATSNTLKIADANDVAAGTLVYRAASDIADIDSFVTYGYDLKLVASSSYDGFVIDGVEFSGLTLDVGNSLELLVGETAVVTASAYPNGTQLPEGTKIEFYLNDADLNYLEGKNLGNNQASVTALAYDEEFSVLNKGTLVAVVLDEYDIQLEEYGEATCDITIVKTKAPTETYKSDTTGDVVVAKGNTYQFKITSLNGQTPSVVLGSDGVFELVGTSVEGSDYFFKFQAVGASGAATGVYVNGDAKVATLYVDGNTGYTCDTTTVNVPAGGTYQVKITAASMPTLLPGNSIYTVAFASQEGNDYFFKITATSAQAGDVVGFYINGGARAFVATTV